jgi:hypothetical protein
MRRQEGRNEGAPGGNEIFKPEIRKPIQSDTSYNGEV